MARLSNLVSEQAGSHFTPPQPDGSSLAPAGSEGCPRIHEFASASLHPTGLHLPQLGEGKNPGKSLPCDSDSGQTVTNALSLKSTFLVSKCVGLVMRRGQVREPVHPSPAAGVSAWSQEQDPPFCPTEAQ